MPRIRHRPTQTPMGGRPHEPRRKCKGVEVAEKPKPQTQLLYKDSFKLIDREAVHKKAVPRRGTEETAVKKATEKGY